MAPWRRLRRLRAGGGMVAAILIVQGVTFAREGDSLATGRGYIVLRAISPDDAVWSGVLLGLGALVLMGAYLQSLWLRLITTFTVAAMLLAMGVTFYWTSPLGLGHTTYGVPGVWMAGRFVVLWQLWRKQRRRQRHEGGR